MEATNTMPLPLSGGYHATQKLITYFVLFTQIYLLIENIDFVDKHCIVGKICTSLYQVDGRFRHYRKFLSETEDGHTGLGTHSSRGCRAMLSGTRRFLSIAATTTSCKRPALPTHHQLHHLFITVKFCTNSSRSIVFFWQFYNYTVCQGPVS